MTVDPRDSSWRYDRGGKAARYRERSSVRRQREALLLEQILRGRDLGQVLDVPCGAGRLAELIDSLSGKWHGVDLSSSMLREARLAGAYELVRARADQLPFADQSFDTVLCFRFLHHLKPELQEELLTELARVASHRVVLSGFSPWSFHEMQRLVHVTLLRRKRARFSSRIHAVDSILHNTGFKRVAFVREGFGRDLWLACWERD